MISYKCKTCGGQLEYGGTGGLKCPYCGSKTFLTDADYKGNEEFRKKLLEYYKAEANNKEFDYKTDFIWRFEGRDSFIMQDGQKLNVEYMKKYSFSGAVCYLARESVVYVFDRTADARAFMAGVRRLDFPSADDKLHRSFPELKMEIGLNADRQALVFRRRPNLYPAEIFAPWPSEHLAWVISRMENVCCALQYSGIEHGDITPASFWVNPVTHEGALFGDWRKVRELRGGNDLSALRKTAIQLADNTRNPVQMYRFLNGAPAADAFEDFSNWDKVITDGFGGHKFIKMNI